MEQFTMLPEHLRNAVDDVRQPISKLQPVVAEACQGLIRCGQLNPGFGYAPVLMQYAAQIAEAVRKLAAEAETQADLMLTSAASADRVEAETGEEHLASVRSLGITGPMPHSGRA